MSLLQKLKSGMESSDQKWNGKLRLAGVNGQHPPLKTPMEALPWTGGSEGGMTEQIDWQAKQPSVACISDLKC